MRLTCSRLTLLVQRPLAALKPEHVATALGNDLRGDLGRTARRVHCHDGAFEPEQLQQLGIVVISLDVSAVASCPSTSLRRRGAPRRPPAGESLVTQEQRDLGFQGFEAERDTLADETPTKRLYRPKKTNILFCFAASAAISLPHRATSNTATRREATDP